MPLIEMHGYGPSRAEAVFANRTAIQDRERIWEALKDAPYIKDVVVTDCYTGSTNYEGETQRYLRIIASAEVKEIVADIERRLIGHFDIEVMPLLRFTLKKASIDHNGPWPLLPFPDDWFASC